MAIQRYDPPGGLTDFDGIPGQLDRWSELVSAWFDSVITDDLGKRLHPGDPPQYFNQLSHPVEGLMEQRIVWNAFPGTLRAWFGREKALEIADRLSSTGGLVPATAGGTPAAAGSTPAAAGGASGSGTATAGTPAPVAPTPGAPNEISLSYRLQDEYCEWHVDRDQQGRIVRVTFTAEPPEYWQALHGDTMADPVTGEPRYTFPGDVQRLLDLYHTYVSPEVKHEDLVFPDDVYARPGDTQPRYRKGQYNPFNRWNTTDGIVHLTHPVNSLGAEIVLGGEASVLRADSSGRTITDPAGLVCASDFGGPNRVSDPTIGSSVNQLALQGRALTLRNPVGLYIHHIDLAGFEAPGGAPVGPELFTTVRGDAAQGMIERAVFEVPPRRGFTVGDLRIAGEPIRWGSQIAEHITMNLVALAGPAGAFTNTPMPAISHCCAPDANGDFLFVRPLGRCGQGEHAAFDWCAGAAPASMAGDRGSTPPRAWSSRAGVRQEARE